MEKRCWFFWTSMTRQCRKLMSMVFGKFCYIFLIWLAVYFWYISKLLSVGFGLYIFRPFWSLIEKQKSISFLKQSFGTAILGFAFLIICIYLPLGFFLRKESTLYGIDTLYLSLNKYIWYLYAICPLIYILAFRSGFARPKSSLCSSLLIISIFVVYLR